MAPRLSGQTSILGVVFFVSKSLLGNERQKKLEEFAILTRKPRSHVRILIYRTWPISKAFPTSFEPHTGIHSSVIISHILTLGKLARDELYNAVILAVA